MALFSLNTEQLFPCSLASSQLWFEQLSLATYPLTFPWPIANTHNQRLNVRDRLSNGGGNQLFNFWYLPLTKICLNQFMTYHKNTTFLTQNLKTFFLSCNKPCCKRVCETQRTSCLFNILVFTGPQSSFSTEWGKSL